MHLARTLSPMGYALSTWKTPSNHRSLWKYVLYAFRAIREVVGPVEGPARAAGAETGR